MAPRVAHKDQGGGTPAKKNDYYPKPEYINFGIELKRHRQGSGFPTQARLAAALDVSWHAVGSWEKGIWSPVPNKVFEIERLLALPPGSLSHYLGYEPSGSQPSVVSAIGADSRLDEQSKELLTQMYRSLVKKRSVPNAKS